MKRRSRLRAPRLRRPGTILLPFVALAAICGSSAGQACVDYGRFMHWLGGGPAPGYAADVDVAGDVAVLACTTGGLQVMDVSDPESPVLIGGVACMASLVALSGDRAHAYAIDSDSQRFLVADVSEPSTPEIVGSVPVQGNVYALAVLGDHVYLANFNQGVQVVDVHDPAAPAVVAATGSNALALAGYDRYLYYVELDAAVTLRALDVQDPLHPVPVGSAPLPYDNYQSLALRGTVLYAACGEGLRTIDVSDPSDPSALALGHTDDLCWDAAVYGNHAFLSSIDGMYSFDITDPGHVVRTGHLEIAETEFLAGIAVSPATAFLAASSAGLRTVDITLPMDPILIGGTHLDGDARGVAVSGDYTLVACLAGGVRVVDASDPAVPAEVAFVNVSSPPEDIAVLGTHAYVVGGSPLMTVLDISDPVNPRIEIAKQLGGGSCTGIALQGGYGYVSNWIAGLQVLDLAAPGNPILIGALDLPGYAKDIAASGHTAYVAAGPAGLAIVDVSNPAAPQLAAVFDLEDAKDVAVAGGYAYVADGSALRVLDVSDPQHPAYVRTINLGAPCNGVSHWASTLYVTGVHGLVAIDITDPAACAVLGSTGRIGQGYASTVRRGYVWVADGARGLQIAPTQCGAQTSVIDDGAAQPRDRVRCVPNPARAGRIEIHATVSAPGSASVEIHDAGGRIVARPFEGRVASSGPWTLLWDGRGSDGRPLASGFYTCRVRAGTSSVTGKLLLVP